MNERLYRSRDDRIVAGVAGGLAHQFGIDPSLIRILWAILIIPTGGLALLLYVIMAVVVPEEPAGDERWAHWDRTASGYEWPDASAASMTSPDAPAAAATDATMPATAPAAPSLAPTPSLSTTSPAPPSPPTPADQRATARLARDEARAERRQARDERREWRREHRDPTGALLFGLLLVLVGGYFLVRAYLPSIDLGNAWPALLVIVGVVLLLGSVRRSSGHPG